MSAGRHRPASVVSRLPRGNTGAVPVPMWWHVRREEHENSELLQMSVCKEEQRDKNRMKSGSATKELAYNILG